MTYPLLLLSDHRTRATITRLKGAIEAGQVKRFRRPTIVFAEMDERIAIPALLNRALPKASYLHPEDSQARTSTRSQEELKIPIPDELPTRIAKWTAFPREAQNWVDGVCLGSDHLTLPGYLGRERLGWKVSCEFDVYYHLQFVLLEPLTEISRRGHIVTLPRFLNYGSLRGSGIKIPGGTHSPNS